MGFVYVVKQVTMYCDPTLSTPRYFFEDDTSGAALFADATNPGQPKWSGFYGALVFEAGQGFHFQVSSSTLETADVYAGGYVLTAP